MANANPGLAGGVATVGDQFGQMTPRRWAFYSVFMLLALLYVLVVLTFQFEALRWISVSTMQAITRLTPLIREDYPVISDVIPALLGAVTATAAPRTANRAQLAMVLVVACVTYLLYLHMSAFFVGSKGIPQDQALGEVMADKGILLEVMQRLTAYLRNFIVFVIASLLGLRVNTGASLPFLAPKQPDPRPDARPAPSFVAPRPATPPAKSGEFNMQDESDDAASAVTPGSPPGSANG